jgi:hypothetical protein
MEDILSLKAHSRGKEFLQHRKYWFWYVYAEPVFGFVGVLIGLAFLGLLRGALVGGGLLGSMWVLGRLLGV